MAGLVRRIPSWQVFPGCSGTKDPEDTVHNIPIIPSFSTTPVLTDGRGNMGSDDLPLFVGEFHMFCFPRSLFWLIFGAIIVS